MDAPEQEDLLIAFEGVRRIAAGPLAEVEPLVQAAIARAKEPVLVFDAASSRPFEIAPAGAPLAPARARGRPKLGVAAKEVTLLPRHWDWLARQPGGASAALRRLVEASIRSSRETDQARMARESAYRFMSAMAGDLPGFEEASRALFRGEEERFATETEPWPADIRDHVASLAEAALAKAISPSPPAG